MQTTTPILDDELKLLAQLVPLDGQHILELGCGAAGMARRLLLQWPRNAYVGLEVDAIQHQCNLEQPQSGITFMAAAAQAVPFADASFDLVLMLKSLHHVPLEDMDKALAEAARVLRPGGHLYVSEPVYDGALNEIVKLYNDEGMVRAAAQAALDRALRSTVWEEEVVRDFMMPVHFDSFDQFERRMMRPTFADHALDDEKVARVRAAFLPHYGQDGADFTRPMRVRCLRRAA